MCALSLAASGPKYEPGKIVDVEQKTRTRVLYYIVNTPVEKEEPYYEVSVQVKDVIYTGEYSARHAADSQPDDWTTGASIQALVAKHYVYIKRPFGEDLRLLITKHEVVRTSTPEPSAGSSKAPDAKPQK